MSDERRIRAVVFDIGETLVNETRFWSSVAAYAGVPELTLLGVLGGLIERREHHRSLYNVMQIESVDYATIGYAIEDRDLYPDALNTIRQLHHEGYLVGVAGNQPAEVTSHLAALELPLAINATSASWGVYKPDPQYFLHMADELEFQPDQVLHVGDRIDNDVIPAEQAGMHAAFLRRGPWGFLHAGWPEARDVRFRIANLSELAPILDTLNAESTTKDEQT